MVFKLSPSGHYTVLHAFAGGSDGANPIGGLYADRKGDLYGTTYYGGASNLGTVFRLSPGGHYTVLHSFSGGDGANPNASLIGDGKGNLYGTAENGGGGGCFGGPGGCGVVFELPPGGSPTVLKSRIHRASMQSTIN